MKGFDSGLAIASSMLIASVAHAANLTTCNESSLRAALAAGGTITFECSGAIIVTQQLVVTVDTVLDATGRNVRLDGFASSRVLFVAPGVQLRLLNLTITNGFAREGAGLYNDNGIVIAENCTFAGNRAVSSAALGGAIWNSGTLTLTQCIFTQNIARGEPGLGGVNGSYGTSGTDPYGRCRVSVPPGNGSSGQPGGNALGGAIYNAASGVVSVLTCTFDSNTAEGGTGGNAGHAGFDLGCWGGSGNAGTPGTGGTAQGAAIHNAGHLAITVSALTANVARGGKGGNGGSSAWVPVGRGGSGGFASGSAIWNTGDLAFTNSTVADNSAFGGAAGDSAFSGYTGPPPCSSSLSNAPGADAEAGAIYNGGTFNAESTTFWNNDAQGGLGGRLTIPYTNSCPPQAPAGRALSATLTASSSNNTHLHNTIIGNLAVTNNCRGPTVDAGYNICSDSSASFPRATSRNATDPRLANLADNGGPTRTCALLPGSPALDQGDPNNCLLTDQRGAARPVGVVCDIGAYEGGPLELPVWSPAFAPDIIATGEISRFTFTLVNPNPVALTQLYFTNNFPPSMVIAPSPNKNMDAQGLLIAFAGQSRLLGIINTLAAGQSCSVAVDLRGIYAGTWNDDRLQVRSPEIGTTTLDGNGMLTILGGASDCYGRWICRLPEGWIKVRLPVAAGETLVLSTSTDLRIWTPIRTNTGPGILEYVDEASPGTPVRFFRAR